MDCRAFECRFLTMGSGSDQYKILKVKWPGICLGRGLHLRFDQRITAAILLVFYATHNMK